MAVATERDPVATRTALARWLERQTGAARVEVGEVTIPGLSGFSNVLTSFNGGQGVIGIHGTNAPEALGSDVSSGCIRMHNDAITRLVQEIGLPLGTPVEIIA